MTVIIDGTNGVQSVGGSATITSFTAIGDTNTGIFFPAADTIAFAEGGVEALRIDSSANVGIGTSSPASGFRTTIEGTNQLRLRNTTTRYRSDFTVGSGGLLINAYDDTGGVYLEAALDGNPVSFRTNGTERARITSGGLFLLNTTTTLRYADAILQSKVVDGWAGTFQHEGTSAQNGALSCVVENTNGRLIRFQYQATEVGAITTNGTNTTYGTGSDVRLKKDIVPAPDAGADVDAINIVSFKWKSNGSETKYGVVAQELVNVSPEAVQKGDDSEDVVAAWGVDYSKLVPMLIKEVQSLRKRVAELEAK